MSKLIHIVLENCLGDDKHEETICPYAEYIGGDYDTGWCCCHHDRDSSNGWIQGEIFNRNSRRVESKDYRENGFLPNCPLKDIPKTVYNWEKKLEKKKLI